MSLATVMPWIGWFVGKVGVGILYLFVSFGVFTLLDIVLLSYSSISPHRNFFIIAFIFGGLLPVFIGYCGLLIRARIKKTRFPWVGFIAASLLGGIPIALDEVYIALYF